MERERGHLVAKVKQHENGSDPVTRREFEEFGERVDESIKEIRIETRKGFAAIQSQLADQSSRGKPSIQTLVLIGLPILSALIVGVQNFTRLDTLSSAYSGHVEETVRRIAQLEELRERTRANEQKQVEEEMQHRWIADVINLTHDCEERLHGACCVQCRAAGRPANEIEFPPSSYSPLAEIGQRLTK